MSRNNEVVFETPESGATAPEPIQEQDFSNEPDRPDWLPSNFKTVQDFVASYDETKASLTRTQQELANRTGEDPEGHNNNTDPQQNNSTPEQPDDSELDDAVDKISKEAKFDLTAYQQEFIETADVSEEGRSEIAEGLKSVLGENSRTVVDQFINSRKVTQANDMAMYMEAGGGEEHYSEMVQWASQNTDAAFIRQFNQQVNSGDRSTVLFAIESLRSKYEGANGRQPRRLGGGNPSKGGVQPFRSTAEMLTAMKDPKYKTDEAYRADVQARMALSEY